MSDQPPDRPRIVPAVVFAVLLGVLLAGCEGVTTLDSEAVRPEIETALRAYLPKLAEAYAERDPSRLEGAAVAKEQAVVELRLAELDQRGEVIDSTLKQLTIEDVNLDRTTAYVTTIEIWDIVLRALGSGTELQSHQDLRYRVRYQLKRQEGRWLVYFRNIQEEPG